MADTILNVTSPVPFKKPGKKLPKALGYPKTQSKTKTVSSRKNKMKK